MLRIIKKNVANVSQACPIFHIVKRIKLRLESGKPERVRGVKQRHVISGLNKRSRLVVPF